MASKTLAKSSSPILSFAAFALRERVSCVVFFPASVRGVSFCIIPYSIKISIRLSLRCLYRCRLRRIPLFRVLSAFVDRGRPFSKFVFSSTLSGLTRTPSFIIEDSSFSFSASLTNAHPIELVPRSSPNIFFTLVGFIELVTTI